MNPNELNALERSILKAKGLTEEQMVALQGLGLRSRQDFTLIGTVETLRELLPGLDESVAARILEWAAAPSSSAAAAAPSIEASKVVVESSDAVMCTVCQHKQPKDYKPGDLCVNCGRQAEPIEQCFWCRSSGPGKFCRNCGAEFVSTSDLPLALLLRQDGLAKDEITKRLREATPEEKEQWWGRVRRARI